VTVHHGGPRSAAPGSVMVIGVGNALRGDDAAGLQVVARIGDEPGIGRRGHGGEPIELLDMWEGVDAVVIVDTIRSGAAVGTIHRIDASAERVPLTLRRASSHTIGLGEAIELARTLGRLPERVIVYGVEGARFAAGDELSEELAPAIDSLVDEVLREARSLLSRRLT
jgi:hydrogenase maturation protease